MIKSWDTAYKSRRRNACARWRVAQEGQGVNRVGQGGGLEFTGGSVIVDPLGRALAQGGCDVGLVAATIDLAQVAEVRRF